MDDFVRLEDREDGSEVQGLSMDLRPTSVRTRSSSASLGSDSEDKQRQKRVEESLRARGLHDYVIVDEGFKDAQSESNKVSLLLIVDSERYLITFTVFSVFQVASIAPLSVARPGRLA